MPYKAYQGGKDTTFRKPEKADGHSIYQLIDECRPLDLNSQYCYLLLCTHFRDTCIIAENDESIVGFISGYIHPGQKDTIFIWQVAVSPSVRSRSIGSKMLDNLVMREGLKGISKMETTIGPTNEESKRLFLSFARRMNAPCNESVFFPQSLFGEKIHEEEVLFSIGPFSRY